MAKINGTNLIVQVGTGDASGSAVTVGQSTSCSLNISVDMPDASNKDSAGWAEVIAGQKSWTVDADGFSDMSSSIDASGGNIEQFFTSMTDRTEVYISFGIKTGTGGGQTGFYSGTGFINSLELSGENEQTSTYSISLTGNGALTFTADTQLS